MNEHKICFIACVNNEKYWEECQLYISRLLIPEGCRVDTIAVWEAASMCSGYNEGMAAADADIKIYLHQDVFVTDPYFLYEITDIFDNAPDVGLIGMVGSLTMSEDAVVWNGPRVSSVYRLGNTDVSQYESCAPFDPDKLTDAAAVDGLLMAANRDIPWREDIFTGWDFYDVSQSREFLKRGLRVVVPEYGRPFCVHDDGLVLNLANYDKYRKIFIEEYCGENN